MQSRGDRSHEYINKWQLIVVNKTILKVLKLNILLLLLMKSNIIAFI